jgi:hypothetical protein
MPSPTEQQRRDEWFVAEEVLEAVPQEELERLAGSLRTPIANRIRRLLRSKRHEDVLEAVRILMGPAGGYLAIVPSLKIIFDHYVDVLGRATLTGVASADDTSRLERSVRHLSQIVAVATLRSSTGPQSVILARLFNRCRTCGGMLIGRGKSPYCSDACKRANQQRRYRESAETRKSARGRRLKIVKRRPKIK